MGQHVNPTAFRLGLISFWKTELYSRNPSRVFKEFFDLYRLLKLTFRAVALEVISLKIFSLKNLKKLVLINSYRYCAFKRKRRNKRWQKKTFSPTKTVKNKMMLRRHTIFLDKRQLDLYFKYVLQQPIIFRMRSIFDSKWKKVLNISKHVYKISKQNWRVRRFVFLKDMLNFINFSFLFLKAELLAYFVAKLIKTHKNVKYIANNVKNNISTFKFYQLMHISLRLAIFGKTRGVARTKTYSFSYGNSWPLQTIHSKLSYDLAQTWNVYGSFGVKVWIFNHLKK